MYILYLFVNIHLRIYRKFKRLCLDLSTELS